MSTSAPGPRKSPASGTGDLRSDDGLWGLVLWSGTAWFSDWFYRRLQWSVSVKHKRLDVLQPHLTDGSWDALLLAILLLGPAFSRREQSASSAPVTSCRSANSPSAPA
jgi:hypothetical protein